MPIAPPNPILALQAAIDQLDIFLLEFEQHDRMIYAGVGVQGKAARYALVWEWGKIIGTGDPDDVDAAGRRRQWKPGPMTVKSINPAGEERWLSIQAPFGYIRTNEPWLWDIVEEEMAKCKFSQPDARAMTLELEKRAFRISQRWAEVISNSAPIRKGELRKGIFPVRPNDPMIDKVIKPKDQWKTLELEEPPV